MMGKRLYFETDRYYKKHFIFLIILWIVSLFLLSIYSYRRLTVDVRNELGNKAVLVAIDIAERFNIQERELNRLLSLDFNQLLDDPINVEFEEKARAVMNFSDIKFIYLLAPLKESQIKYIVEEGEETIYNAPAGTPLNVIYLLDAVESYETRLKDTNGKWYVDKDRYNVASNEYKKVLKNEQPVYKISTDRWGTFITGYAPFYDGSGNAIGLIGVDILLDKYLNSIKKNLFIVLGFLVSNIAIGVLAIVLILSVRKSDRQAYEKNILSCTDDLTLILNRRGFTKILKEELKKSYLEKKYISLLLVDVDYFKEYNDTYGHLAGDDALRSIAIILESKAKEYGGFSGRYGGDEFSILLPDTSDEEAEKIANIITEDIANINPNKESSLGITCSTVSIGVVSLIPDVETTIETLIDYADTALYKSKRYGRNKVYTWNGNSLN